MKTHLARLARREHLSRLHRAKTPAVLAAAAAAFALSVGALGSAEASPATARAGAAQSVAAQSLAAQPAAAEAPALEAKATASYDAFDARQGIAVDRKHFYAVSDSTITKHDRATGKPLLQFAGREDGPYVHFDSAAAVGDKLYAAHSNYSGWPMESSIEIFDTRTMRHIGTHSFGIDRGSLTWLDRHNGAWWAAFANYDKERKDKPGTPYGETYNTKVVKLDDDFQVVESWSIPKQILDKFKPMSNSGGSWGPDGRLYLTGHDLPETYVMKLPHSGSVLEHVATVALPGIEGQGIAWEDAGRNSALWGISRDNEKVFRFDLPLEKITDPKTEDWKVLGPGEFVQE
ncbi:hypothetical protein AB0C51_22045 [Streptomyces pathocidini]|uniref:hypothetical protein n=1 Tax=Streptomyces pathocidini TaxID=1650571 RepID=UPI0033F2455F